MSISAPIFERLGLVKSRYSRTEGKEEEKLTEEESFIKNILVENEALEYSREVTGDDLIEMGITDITERETAWRLLRKNPSPGSPSLIKDKDGKNDKKSKSSSRKQNKGILSQDGLAWGAEEHWKGWRNERLTMGYFPCCLCAWLCRKTFSDAETYSLTNVALFVSVRSGIFCPTVRLMTIYLHSITSLTIVEEDPITGTKKVGGVPLLKHHTKIHVHTSLGPRIAIRVKRIEADRIYDDIMVKVNSARALRAETTATDINQVKNTKITWGQRAGLGFIDSLKTSLINSGHDLFWYRVSVFALASIVVNGLALGYVDADRSTEHYQTAIELYIAAIAFNAASLIPLYLITTILRTNRAITDAESAGFTGYSRAHNSFKYQYTTLMASRAAYLLCDISADFLQFVAQLQLSLAVGNSISETTIILSIINLMGLALSVLEIHNEMIEWAGTKGRCVHFESKLSFLAVVGSFTCAIVIYALFCATGSYDDRKYYGTLFIITVASVIFGSMFIGVFFVSCEALKNYCCGITVEYFDNRGGGTSSYHGSTKKNERESALGQLIDMITKL